MSTISPDTYDIVVVGSGLPECLVAASLLKSGKSVLIIDAVDTYGTEFASFTPAALQAVIAEEAGVSPGAHAIADRSASVSLHAGGEHEHSLPTCSPVSGPLPPGCRLVQLQQRSLPLSGIRALAAPEEGGGADDRRSYILDLAPKLVYQSEPLVDVLVRCRCHHYLEFKALEGSYLLQEGALHPVPAGRSDIFRDRRLSLTDKRLLMRFIQGCTEARSGQGHLKEVLNSTSHLLVQILTAEGLTPRLREVILYGIAICDTDQETPPLPQSLEPPQAAADLASAGGSGLMSGSAGGAALELFTSSQGRFGHESAFMMPSYGSGSMTEAFVRLCAVHGAVTVLRQPVQALVVGPPEADVKAAEEAEEVEVHAAPKATVQTELAAGEGRIRGNAGDEGAAAASPADSCVGIVTAAGQVVRCGVLVASAGTLSCLAGTTRLTPPEYVSRAVVVLDGPLIPATLASEASASLPPHPPLSSPSRSLLTLVVPPRCRGLTSSYAAAVSRGGHGAPGRLSSGAAGDGCGGGGGGDGHGGLGNPHPVRVLQQGASTCVCPPGRFLMYLSTPASSSSSYDDLWPTLDCLTDTSALQDTISIQISTTMPAAASASIPAPDLQAASAAAPPPPRPRALRAWFYRQSVLPSSSTTVTATSTGASPAMYGGIQHLPGRVVALPGDDGGLVGYGRVLEATEAAFRSAFPNVKWLSEADFMSAQVPDVSGESSGKDNHQAGGDSGRIAHAGDEEEDEDEDAAINALTAALSRLKDS